MEIGDGEEWNTRRIEACVSSEYCAYVAEAYQGRGMRR